ncbi:hypothetical protein RRG08_059699 [Elysia crispata]|uniref:Uncharacterized protein n=1 Tax=Elysia crispata TaxID=231223 RepID=A0AAE1DPR7_9GAST|nr:hypothetical protein RRG08_059699 [Elysia crispata]
MISCSVENSAVQTVGSVPQDFLECEAEAHESQARVDISTGTRSLVAEIHHSRKQRIQEGSVNLADLDRFEEPMSHYHPIQRAGRWSHHCVLYGRQRMGTRSGEGEAAAGIGKSFQGQPDIWAQPAPIDAWSEESFFVECVTHH